MEAPVGLGRETKVSEEVAETNLRPDMIITSRRLRRMGVIELTVPSEERIEVSSKLKKTMYAALQRERKARG